MQGDQAYAESHVMASHVDALGRFGEFVMFVLMWTAGDYQQGLVGKCSLCIANDPIAKAYDQPADSDCPGCFGTTFEGGWRAQIIRPAILTDRNTETKETRRGEVVTDAVSIETTSDFFSRSGDFMFRQDGTRWQMDQMDTITIRTGMEHPTQDQTIGGLIPSAKMEDDVAATVHVLDPPAARVRQMLERASLDRHLMLDTTRQDIVRAPLVPARI